MSELIELSGGQMDDNLAAKFETITRTILSNQTDALNTLTSKVEKDIGQVWRQMGIMYGQLSNSINILEKVGNFCLPTEVKCCLRWNIRLKNSPPNQTRILEVWTIKLRDSPTGATMNMENVNLENNSWFRMSEVDDNLNYMLGQLSLVVSEFNQVWATFSIKGISSIPNLKVKNGLGEAMEGLGEDLLEEYKKSGDSGDAK